MNKNYQKKKIYILILVTKNQIYLILIKASIMTCSKRIELSRLNKTQTLLYNWNKMICQSIIERDVYLLIITKYYLCKTIKLTMIWVYNNIPTQ